MENTEIDAFQVLESVDVRVGKCSVQDLFQILNPCMREFYMAYRKIKDVDCLKNYMKMRECVKREASQCFQGIDIDDENAENIVESIVEDSLPMDDAVKFCERSGIDAPLHYDEDGIKYCSDEFYTKSQSLTADFNSVYNMDRGSQTLCQKYEDYGKSILKLAEECCRPSLYRFMHKQMGWAESKKLNPFCSDEQVLGGS